MSGVSTAVPLENDARNPCVGCGPENPVGLRLRFVREGAEVSTTLVAGPTLQGWPSRLHSGILYLALLETANWTVFALRGRVGLPTRTSALEATRLVVTGERLRLTGRGAASGGEALQVIVEAHDEHGALVARIEREFQMLDRTEMIRRLGYEGVPPELEELLPR